MTLTSITFHCVPSLFLYFKQNQPIFHTKKHPLQIRDSVQQRHTLISSPIQHNPLRPLAYSGQRHTPYKRSLLSPHKKPIQHNITHYCVKNSPVITSPFSLISQLFKCLLHLASFDRSSERRKNRREKGFPFVSFF
ncbi:hypothetical protein BCY86_03750 [Pajaroellobacter abortibovis]|uniref:Uncharacterized protein n=1 Tax=Pajaroellobacter abortibovis TaxID=1882918 RepID=A0A1L6MWF7_9BACT|nr:hypothetical protein BCY86_03750 [Pajaroellobacter abortibovis]